MSMYKIGMIGDRASTLGFLSLGFAVHEAANAAEAVGVLHEWVASGEYAIIYLTEELAAEMEEETARYKDLPLPAVVSIPGRAGSTGYGKNNLRAAAERAVGADILFKD